MSQPRSTVLVTGANGFVGARLCRVFASHNCRVIAGVRKSADLSQLDGIPVEYRYGDITLPETLPSMVKDIDILVHNAGVVKVKKEKTFFDVNEGGTRSLLEAVANHCPSIQKVVYISSLAMMGPSVPGTPMTEDALPNPLTAYARSKMLGEKVALSYTDKFNVLAVRPPGVYGPGDKEIFTFFQTVNRHIKPFIGDVSRRIQLVHVDDLCRGIYLAATSDTKSGQSYFVAEKNSYSMKELIGLLTLAAGTFAIGLPVPGPVFELIALISKLAFKTVGAVPMLTPEKADELLGNWEVSTEKAKRDFGYESHIAFADGAKETYEWYRKEGWL